MNYSPHVMRPPDDSQTFWERYLGGRGSIDPRWEAQQGGGLPFQPAPAMRDFFVRGRDPLPGLPDDGPRGPVRPNPYGPIEGRYGPDVRGMLPGGPPRQVPVVVPGQPTMRGPLAMDEGAYKNYGNWTGWGGGWTPNAFRTEDDQDDAKWWQDLASGEDAQAIAEWENMIRSNVLFPNMSRRGAMDMAQQMSTFDADSFPTTGTQDFHYNREAPLWSMEREYLKGDRWDEVLNDWNDFTGQYKDAIQGTKSDKGTADSITEIYGTMLKQAAELGKRFGVGDGQMRRNRQQQKMLDDEVSRLSGQYQGTAYQNMWGSLAKDLTPEGFTSNAPAASRLGQVGPNPNNYGGNKYNNPYYY